MTIQQSRDYLTNRTGWMIDESTFQSLDNDKCVWIARVMTTHLSARGEQESSFTVLAQGFNHFTINDKYLPALLDWLLKQQKG